MIRRDLAGVAVQVAAYVFRTSIARRVAVHAATELWLEGIPEARLDVLAGRYRVLCRELHTALDVGVSDDVVRLHMRRALPQLAAHAHTVERLGPRCPADAMIRFRIEQERGKCLYVVSIEGRTHG
ncbi:MAG: hypothetical protein IT379_30365 [Deltaproteobacteria bacterium]|nr:hypothetical protein [Deltaproteobacteria bacterium]